MMRALILSAISALALAASAQADWPLNPKQGPHPIRAGMLDLRLCEWQHDGSCWRWHNAADIVVDERTCNPNAPARGCKRIYSVAGGRVRHDGNRRYCAYVRVGAFMYAHIYSRVREGKGVKRGKFLGWSCKGHWHVHLGYSNGGDVLAADGPLINRVDPGAPIVKDVRVQDGEVWARIEDPVDPSWLPGSGLERLYNDMAPAEITVNGVPLWTGRPYPAVPSLTAPLYRRNVPVPMCALMTEGDCSGEYWWRLGAYDPAVAVQVRAVDYFGNATEVTLR